MQQQLQYNFKPKIATGKKTERITITCPEEFKQILDLIANMTDSTTSELGFRYCLAGIQADLGTLFMATPHLDKSLREIISKFQA